MTFTPSNKSHSHFTVIPCYCSGQALAPHWKISAAREKSPLEIPWTSRKAVNQLMLDRWQVWFSVAFPDSYMSVGLNFLSAWSPVLTHRQSKPPLNSEQGVSKLRRVLNPLKCHGLDSILSNWVNFHWCVAEWLISQPYHLQDNDLNSAWGLLWRK